MVKHCSTHQNPTVCPPGSSDKVWGTVLERDEAAGELWSITRYHQPFVSGPTTLFMFKGINSRTLTIFDPSKIGFPYPTWETPDDPIPLVLTYLGQIQTSTVWTYGHNLPGNMSEDYEEPPWSKDLQISHQSWNISTSLHQFHVQGSGLCTWTLKFGHRSLSTLAGGGWRDTHWLFTTEPHVLSIIHVGHPNMTDMIWHDLI